MSSDPSHAMADGRLPRVFDLDEMQQYMPTPTPTKVQTQPRRRTCADQHESSPWGVAAHGMRSQVAIPAGERVHWQADSMPQLFQSPVVYSPTWLSHEHLPTS